MERKSPVNLRASEAFLDQLGEEEGWIPYAYDDADPKSLKTFITEDNVDLVKGTLTIGHGHTRTVKPGMRITREEGRSLLRSDIRDAESCVHRFVKVPLTQGEFDGMTDLFFNVGPGSLPNTFYPNGKDGIACLGKSGGGRASTLLTVLNNGDYEAAARCFTQWRMPGSVFEWGLLKRRIRLMLMFMGLPITRAALAFPNTIPQGDVARADFVSGCIARAKEELEDMLVLKPAPKIPTPQPAPKAPVSASGSSGGVDELVLKDPIVIPPRPEAAPDVATRDVGAGPVAVASPSGSAAPPKQPVDKPLPNPSPSVVPLPGDKMGEAPAKPVAPATPAPSAPPSKPPPKPIILDQKSIDVRSIPYGEIDPARPAKNASDSRRVIGMIIVGIGSIIYIFSARGFISSAVAGIIYDVSRDSTLVALGASAISAIGGWSVIKRGRQVITKGFMEATQLMK